MLTVRQFEELFPNCRDPKGWVEAMNEVLPENEINTPRRIAAFIAQCGHESGGWRTFSENLNYSAKALNVIFPKYFERAGREAEDYHRQPERIANVIYANRMGNGDILSGDGWRYRGRGPIQLTGYYNYVNFSGDMGIDADVDPDMVSEDKEVALLSAIWFWNKNNLNRYADDGDIKTMTRRINGGYIGLEDRIHHWEKALEMMGVESLEDDGTVNDGEFSLIKRGMRGESVALLQEALGLDNDGIFGPGTEKALKRWQLENGLISDGIAGPMALNKLIK
jgi:putative chitinase